MGLITGLFTLPLAPVRGVTWAAEHVAAEARHQRRERLLLELKELEQQLQRQEITEDEFDRREDAVLDQLEELGPAEV